MEDKNQNKNTNVEEQAADKFLPKPKSNENQSAARASFDSNSITEKEAQILNIALAQQKNEGFTTAAAIAAELSGSVNVVNGSVSVLMAKGLVTTERRKVDGKVVRTMTVTITEPVTASEKPKKEKPPKEDKPKKGKKSKGGAEEPASAEEDSAA